MGEIRSLTGLRGIAALWVVALHLEFTRAPFINNGYLGVDLFFVLSGYVMALNYGWPRMRLGDYCRFLRKRLARTYPLYVFTAVAAYCLAYFGIARLAPVDGQICGIAAL